MCKANFYLFILVIIYVTVNAQTDYVNDNQMRYEDWSYKPYIQTVQLHESSFDANPAIIKLYGTEQLELSFDDLEADIKSYSISFVHCNANWEPSNLMVSEYLEGFYDANILSSNFSTNTIQKYTHYRIFFPQTNLKFTKSGNYIVYVYQDFEKEKLIATKRFMIYDDKVTLLSTIQRAIGDDSQETKQHIDFSLVSSTYEITNPFTDLQIVATQNNRWDNAVRNVKPTFTEPTKLTYSLDDKLTFDGGNEFRFFDTRSLRTYTERIYDIKRDSSFYYHIDLKTDELKTYKNYTFYNDLNGGFLIKNQDVAGNNDIEADYAWVNFFFPYDNAVSEGNFYVVGKFTEWRLNKLNKMSYNYKKLGYECSLYVKQGYYNYTYLYLQDKHLAGDATLTEGNHWETENDYTIYAYHRQRGTYYDQLIGIKRLNSRRK